MERTETALLFLECQREGRVEELLELLTEDAVLNNPMRGATTGREAIAEEARGGRGILNPEVQEPFEAGDQVKVSAKLPPGAPIPSLTFTFSFRGNLISRIDIGM